MKNLKKVSAVVLLIAGITNLIQEQKSSIF